MRITLLGAAGEVTGSSYLIESRGKQILLDFGIFQGRGSEEKNILPEQIDPRALSAVILTHGHLDHVGRLPLLAKHGYTGPVFSTPATVEMAGLVLKDSAKVQAQDILRQNKRRVMAGEEPLEPIYTPRHVELIMSQFRPVPYQTPTEIAPGFVVRMREAGHMLGSASIEVRAGGRTAVFSGDLGPRGVPILRDPHPFECADMVFLESTYGNRNHKPLADTVAEFETIVKAATAKGGKIMVPSFAIGRTQQILYYLGDFFRRGVVKPFPVYVDSPMAIEATHVYSRHPELYDEEALELDRKNQFVNDLPTLRLSETPDDSRAINEIEGPCMVIAGAGMCNAGRILHHLKHNLWRPQNALIIVGFQSEGSLGRTLVNGAKHVNIFGEKIAVKSSVHTLGGFSAHAGQKELVEWFEKTLPCKPQVTLTHGEEDARNALGQILHDRFDIRALKPQFGQVVEV